MPELTPSERLQPCLLDRLADDEPQNQQESRNQRVISPQKLRRAVLRDLEWLFNARAFPLPEQLRDFDLLRRARARINDAPEPFPDLRDHPQAVRSVLNFGIRQLCGMVAPDMPLFERLLAEAIRNFEPRIVPQSVRVQAVQERNAVSFEVQGELRGTPVPEQLFIRTTVDLETGRCDVGEAGHG